jgi:hypothetical protein
MNTYFSKEDKHMAKNHLERSTLGSKNRNHNQQSRARWWIRSTYHCDFVNEKSQVTQEALYYEERKRGKLLGSVKEVSRWHKGMKKLRQQKKAASSSKFTPAF